jgi:CRISPR-associated protein (TIGR03986 family)
VATDRRVLVRSRQRVRERGVAVTVYYVVHSAEPLQLIPMGDADEDLQGLVPGTLDMEWNLEEVLEPVEVGQVFERIEIETENYLYPTDKQAAKSVVENFGTVVKMPNPENGNRPEALDLPKTWLDFATGVITSTSCREAWRYPSAGRIDLLGLVLRPVAGADTTVSGRHEAVEREVRHRQSRGRAFVNPYNFVPLPEVGPLRLAPEGHLRLAEGNLSGRIEVTFEAVTPLALPGNAYQGVTSPYVVNNERILPGSSLGGAVRAFHESLTGSCLRIVDPGFRPVHRETARARDARWRLAVVESGDGVEVRLCEVQTHDGKQYPVVWVEGSSLPGRPSAAKRYSGRPVSLDATAGRLEGLAGGMTEDEDGPWVALIAAKGARGANVAYHCAIGRLSDETAAVSQEVLQAYALTAEDAEDVVKRRRGDVPDTLVRHGNFTGDRQEIREHLSSGDVVWVKLHGKEIVEVSRSAIWRVLGDYELSKRIGSYTPCDDPTHLCPSCSLFGMVDDEGGRTGEAQQRAYRGHVRFGDAGISEVDEEVAHLARMGQPRPGSSQFYLDTDAQWSNKLASENERPLRDWGSEVDDSETPRLIRGRKRYWPQTTAPPRHRLPNHARESRFEAAEPGADTTAYQLVPVAAELTATIHFDNLRPDQLGALILSVDPQLFGQDQRLAGLVGLPQTRQFVLQLGRGKNVGLGSVRTKSLRLSVEGLARYTGSGSVGVKVSDAVKAFHAWVQTSSSAIRESWTSLAALCMLDRVPPETLTYPPDDECGADFQFDFWKSSSGAYLKAENRGGRGLTLLPPADAPHPFIKPKWWG